MVCHVNQTVKPAGKKQRGKPGPQKLLGGKIAERMLYQGGMCTDELYLPYGSTLPFVLALCGCLSTELLQVQCERENDGGSVRR